MKFTFTTFLTIPLISISHSIIRDFSVSNFDFPILLNSWTRDDTGIELEDELLEEDDDESVSLESLTDVAADDDDS